MWPVHSATGDIDDCIVAVEHAFRQHALGRSIPPGVLPASTVVVDVPEQCAVIGDLHHALELCGSAAPNVHAVAYR